MLLQGRISLLVAASSVALGCTSDSSRAAQSDSAARRDSTAAVAAATMGEPHVLGLLELTHSADSALGALGAARGDAPEVKEFGRMILREHHALKRDLLQVAERLGATPVSPPVPPDAPSQALRDSVAATQPGAAWDRAYMSFAMATHVAAMENTARALASTRRTEIRAFIDKSVPILQKHLDKARSLSRTLPEPEPTDSARSRAAAG